MNKTILNKAIIKKELMKQNSFIFSLCWMFIPATIFLVILGTSIYCFINSDFNNGIKLLVCLSLPTIVTLILGAALNAKQSFRDYRNIKRDLFQVKVQTCIDTNKQEFESDGTSYKYTWIFEKDVKIIMYDSNIDLFDKYGTEGDYLLIFLNNNKSPRLFYNAKQFKYSEN